MLNELIVRTAVLACLCLVVVIISYGVSTNESAVGANQTAYLYYDFYLPAYELSPPWRSAMAQSEALGIMAKAHEITGDPEYLRFAEALLNSLFVDATRGGVTYKTMDDGWWYELYASDHGKQPRVLNGMLYTLFALYDYYNITGDATAKYLFERGMTSLNANLSLYDDNGYSRYDLLDTPMRVEYHNIHIDLLEKLYNITGEPILRFYQLRWGDFPITNQTHLGKVRYILDRQGVPWVDYGVRDNQYLGLQRNPVVVNHIATDFYNIYVATGNKVAMNLFLNNARWLMNSSNQTLIR